MKKNLFFALILFSSFSLANTTSIQMQKYQTIHKSFCKIFQTDQASLKKSINKVLNANTVKDDIFDSRNREEQAQLAADGAALCSTPNATNIDSAYNQLQKMNKISLGMADFFVYFDDNKKWKLVDISNDIEKLSSKIRKTHDIWPDTSDKVDLGKNLNQKQIDDFKFVHQAFCKKLVSVKSKMNKIKSSNLFDDEPAESQNKSRQIKLANKGQQMCSLPLATDTNTVLEQTQKISDISVAMSDMFLFFDDRTADYFDDLEKRSNRLLSDIDKTHTLFNGKVVTAVRNNYLGQ